MDLLLYGVLSAQFIRHFPGQKPPRTVPEGRYPEVILSSDWVIDLGPEGGLHGGLIVAEGSPRDIMKCQDSATGISLR